MPVEGKGTGVKFASGIAEDAMNGVTINAHWIGTGTPVNITAVYIHRIRLSEVGRFCRGRLPGMESPDNPAVV